MGGGGGGGGPLRFGRTKGNTPRIHKDKQDKHIKGIMINKLQTKKRPVSLRKIPNNCLEKELAGGKLLEQTKRW